MKRHKNLFEKIASAEALFSAWDRFKVDKRYKRDVLYFEKDLEKKIFKLQRELRDKTYRHDGYTGFRISDPKLRDISKATVRDRILHHAVFAAINPIFEPSFIPNSFSCRIGKGTHKGVAAVAKMLRSESRNNTRPCFALKCDVRKFFDSIDHAILFEILENRISDSEALWLMREIIASFSGSKTLFDRKGIPIGNLTSQLFANVYMNEFDQFMKHGLRVRHYARYTDDFIIVSTDKEYLESLVPKIETFLHDRLRLKLHPDKIMIRKYRQGVDFLGYIVLPHCVLPRAKTKSRMFRKLEGRVAQHREGLISESTLEASLQSYLGVLSHANAYRVAQDLQNRFWLWLKR